MSENRGDLARADGERVAWRRTAGRGPTVLWLGGFRSDMAGTKAEVLAGWAQGCGRDYLRFDYFGHGESSGDFLKGTITRWRGDALAVIDELTQGPLVLVGSSMGGWLALLLTRELKRRGHNGAASIAGMVLIAPAVDFTEELMWKRFTPEIKGELEATGVWARPSQYAAEPYLVTRQLIEEGRKHLLLGGLIETGCPVRILQGVEDPDVPWQHAVELTSRLASDDVVLTLVKDGDHRLSRPEDIERMIQAVKEF
jgi:pimeloyl-ACP methyl ester carboxylesterase